MDAEPYAYPLAVGSTVLVIIDMQRDFLDPGGFGDSLGNDVSRLCAAIGPLAAVIEAARAAGMLVVPMREGHRPDLSDLSPAKHRRGNFPTKIGDSGPMAASSSAERSGPGNVGLKHDREPTQPTGSDEVAV
jgi:nicotinamidase-related amidase